MFDGQHDSEASVGSNVLHRKPARIRVVLSPTAGVLSALTPLLIKEASFLLSENRQSSEGQEHAHKSRCPWVTRPETGATGVDCEFPFLCGLGMGSLALVLVLHCVSSAALRPTCPSGAQGTCWS